MIEMNICFINFNMKLVKFNKISIIFWSVYILIQRNNVFSKWNWHKLSHLYFFVLNSLKSVKQVRLSSLRMTLGSTHLPLLYSTPQHLGVLFLPRLNTYTDCPDPFVKSFTDMCFFNFNPDLVGSRFRQRPLLNPVSEKITLNKFHKVYYFEYGAQYGVAFSNATFEVHNNALICNLWYKFVKVDQAVKA